jgi:branched-chain amino acid transport system permease protein
VTDIARAPTQENVTAPALANRLRAATPAYLPWIILAALFVALPLVLRSATALTMMSLMGVMIVFSLSYNILLGQTGLLSFGHAVYYGLGAFAAAHAMNAIIRGGWPVPLPLIPFVGGLGGLFFALLFGPISTRRGGTVFAMISLGLAELISSSALILRSFFGGEEGITTNRTKLLPVIGIKFGPQIEVYYLIAAWCFICILLMYLLTRTSLGRLCNAVRDNAQRVEFIGYNPRTVRSIAFAIAGFFAGIAGSLAAINFEIVNSSYVGLSQSGTVLLATYVGGVGYFAGPIAGAVVISFLQTMLSDITEVWQLYFGLLFIIIVMYAPSGLAGIAAAHLPILRAGMAHRLLPSYTLLAIPALALLGGTIMLVELVYRATATSLEGTQLTIFEIAMDAATWPPWAVGCMLLAVGAVGVRFAAPRASEAWHSSFGAAQAKAARAP